MKFRTEYMSRADVRPLDPETTAVLLGSCFTESIGERMRTCCWRAYPNPCGVLYNPASIANILSIALDISLREEEDKSRSWYDIIDDSMAQRDRLYVTWLMDSGCTTYSVRDTRERAWYMLDDLRNSIKEARTLIVTFGTAWIYELRERPGYVVSNCHKFPADTFERRRMTIGEITTMWNTLLAQLQKRFPDLRVIFTVSPVRHLKDGFEGNSRSKAILQLACEEICASRSNAEYFPSYEILNDDLRDYRFYAADMVHPSTEAVEYIWEKFQERYLTQESRALLREGERVAKALSHRPILHGNSELAQNAASLERLRASQRYNEFIAAHPNMLYIDQ